MRATISNVRHGLVVTFIGALAFIGTLSIIGGYS
jgi:hypothetical protein